jgi:serine/threonine-protein kinase SRPK3
MVHDIKFKNDIFKNDIFKNDVFKNDIFKNNVLKSQQYNGYTFIRKLGKGKFSDVWLAIKNNKKFAIKVAKKWDKYKKDFKDEINFLEHFVDSNFVINKVDDFVINVSLKLDGKEISKKCYCIVLEFLGQELLWLIDNYKDNGCNIPKNIIIKLTKQITIGLCELYDNNLIHTDLKPENILLTCNFSQDIFQIPKKKYLKLVKDKIGTALNIDKNKYELLRELILFLHCNVKISDLGNACYNNKHYSNSIVTRHYRPLEIIIGNEYNLTLDMWSLGCIIYELVTQELLFNPVKNNMMSINSNHLALMIKTFGKIPKKLIKDSKYGHKYFDVKNRNPQYLFNYLIGKRMSLSKVFIQYWNINADDAFFYEKLVEPLFEYDSKKRMNAIKYINYINSLNQE